MNNKLLKNIIYLFLVTSILCLSCKNNIKIDKKDMENENIDLILLAKTDWDVSVGWAYIVNCKIKKIYKGNFKKDSFQLYTLKYTELTKIKSRENVILKFKKHIKFEYQDGFKDVNSYWELVGIEIIDNKQ
jgi:hypothetical protein